MDFQSRLLDALQRLITSSKVYTAIIGVAVLYCAKHGIILDPDMVKEVMVIFSALLVGQGAADFGKAKAQIEAANPKPPEQVNIQTVTPPTKEN